MEPVEKTYCYTEADYYALPDERRVELIDGKFYDMAAPSQLHQEMLMLLAGIISDHIFKNKGKCKVIPAPFDVKLEESADNIVQPDISVICDRDKLNGKRCNGAPDWVIEIASPGSVNQDCVKKLKLYQKAGVKEYWIIEPEDESVMVYSFNEKLTEFVFYEFKDAVPSGILNGLSIDFNSVLERIRS